MKYKQSHKSYRLKDDSIMKSPVSLIIVALLIILIILFFSLPFSSFILNDTTGPSINLTSDLPVTYYGMNKLPTEVKGEIRNYERKYNFIIDKWKYDEVNTSQINLYAHDFQNESVTLALLEKQIGNYTIRIIRDTEFETTKAEVFSYLMDLQKKPEYQIAYISLTTDSSVDPTAHIAKVAVFGLTPENEELNNTFIKGWKIETGVIKPIPVSTSPRTTGDSFK